MPILLQVSLQGMQNTCAFRWFFMAHILEIYFSVNYSFQNEFHLSLAVSLQSVSQIVKIIVIDKQDYQDYHYPRLFQNRPWHSL